MGTEQKISVGGWDATVLEEARLMFKGDHVITLMLDRIEDTLEYDDVVENLEHTSADVDSLNITIDNLENDVDRLTKERNALRADAAEARAAIQNALNCFGKHGIK